MLNQVVTYDIAVKNNKNTYFHFKRDGYIQINLSKHQNENLIRKYMKSNEMYFLNKYNKNCLFKKPDPTKFNLWGTEHSINIGSEINTIEIDNVIIDHNENSVKNYYKNEMLNYLLELDSKYHNNGFIDISNLKYKTRYTTTRHGSCNPKKRTININLNLVRLNKKFTEYVYLHEICHLAQANHSQKFYDLLYQVCPNYKEIRKELKLQR